MGKPLHTSGSGRETGPASYVLESIGQRSPRTQGQGRGNTAPPYLLMGEISKPVWLPHFPFHLCLSETQSRHLPPSFAPASPCLVQVWPPNHPSLRATEFLCGSSCLLPCSALRTQSRQIQSQGITGTGFWGTILQLSPSFGTHEGFGDQVFLFLARLTQFFGISSKKGGVFCFVIGPSYLQNECLLNISSFQQVVIMR